MYRAILIMISMLSGGCPDSGSAADEPMVPREQACLTQGQVWCGAIHQPNDGTHSKCVVDYLSECLTSSSPIPESEQDACINDILMYLDTAPPIDTPDSCAATWF